MTSGGDTGVTGAGGSNTTGGGVSTTSSPGVEVGKETTRPDDFDGGKSSASLLPFNLCILFLLLPAAAIYTAPFNV